MNSPLQIQEFATLAQNFPVIDVRSPGEFNQGHIPGAYNIPLFDNEEQAKIGATYVKIGREVAIELGYEIANPKINSLISQLQAIVKPLTINSYPRPNDSSVGRASTILIHCWRGGLRSSKFALRLNEHGYKTHTLVQGYKAYRNFVLQSFNSNADIIIIGGETGSGKTEILKNIAASGEQVVDLEALAHHKGSAFGSLGEIMQPTYEQFENDLHAAFSKLDMSKRIWLEDESRNIGKTQIPSGLWDKMKQAPIVRVTIPKNLRIERLLVDYGNFSKQELANCIVKIQQRLGPQHEKRALEELKKGNLHEVADIALAYYDKAYNYNHEKRNMKDVSFIECDSADALVNSRKVIEFANNKIKKHA